MKKISTIILFLFAFLAHSQTTPFSSLPKAPGPGYCIITLPSGVQTYTPCSSITGPTQTLSISGQTISLSAGGGSVTIPTQTVPLTASTVTTALGYVPLQTEVDGSVTNEIQTISINSGTISLSDGGGSITLPINTSSTTILTQSTGITVSGTAPNYTVTNSLPNVTQSLSISTNTLILSGGGGSITLPTSTLTSITASTGISITSGSVITNTAPNQTVTLTAGNNATVTGTYPTYTISAGSTYTAFVTPEQFGAVGNGSTNDGPALNAAFNSGSNVMIGLKNYRTTDELTIPSNVGVFGLGAGSIISSVTNSVIIKNVGSSNTTISNLQILGNTAGSNQIGIQLLGVSSLSVDILNNKISGCYFTNLYTGVSTTSVVGSTSGAKHEGSLSVINNTFFGNTYGLRLGTRAEYNITSINKFEQCSTAVEMSGGNNNLNGDYITDCPIGIQFISSSNDTHSSATGVKINHCPIGITGGHALSFEFNACQIFASNISLTSVGKTIFNGGEIGLSTNTLVITNSPVFFNSVNFSEAVGGYSLTGNSPMIVNTQLLGGMMVTPTTSTSTTFILNNGSVAKNILNVYANSVLKIAVGSTGNITLADAVNFIFSSTTGTQIGGSGCKLSFYNATAIVQPIATTEIGLLLSNLGLRASGTAWTINTTGIAATGSHSVTGNLSLTTAGNGIIIKSGTNAKAGQSTLVAGTVTVANTSVAATSVVIVVGQGTTNAGMLTVTQTAGVGFTITSSIAIDTRVVNWVIIDQN